MICLNEELEVRNAPLVAGSTSLFTCMNPIHNIAYCIQCVSVPDIFCRKKLHCFPCGLITQMPLDCQPSVTTVVPQQGHSAAGRNRRPLVPSIQGEEVRLIWVGTSQERKLYLSSKSGEYSLVCSFHGVVNQQTTEPTHQICATFLTCFVIFTKVCILRI